jgi:hypothetical protein
MVVIQSSHDFGEECESSVEFEPAFCHPERSSPFAQCEAATESKDPDEHHSNGKQVEVLRLPRRSLNEWCTRAV